MRSRELETYKKQLSLTKLQKEVMVGILLGDAHLETQNKGITFRLKIEQSSAHRAYVTHLFTIFEEWVRTPPKRKEVRSKHTVSENYCFQTLSHGSFRFFAQQFYRGKRKCVPSQIHRWLTPCALAYWYMDDGSVKSAQSKGVIFNTQGFSLKEVERLCAVLLESFRLDAKPRKQSDGHQIYLSGRSFEGFCDLVSPHLIDEMRYKLPKARLTQLPKE